ncbi:hypothetical protein EDB92DRAFT_1954047 [Lactarius akahatsu]|uniref:CCHC-type domain-containing protein n=1 Tax=Lactarius akahatsu TaxID=416441 RepID=A0AAD4Q383_9AGAM|nr:hypothetical protein EDB92DRAFT_1954047 [Lactarius akahatsu]
MATTPDSGTLKGLTPKEFVGDRQKSVQFLREFHQYQCLNRDHKFMISLFSQVSLALSELDKSVMTHEPKMLETDEALWTNFEAAFKRTWTDTLSKQNAHQQLTSLVMKGDNVDTYISMFDCLATAAGWDADANGMIEFFKRGLKKGLLISCLKRGKMPKKMEEWRKAARKESQCFHTITNAIANVNTGKLVQQMLGQTLPTKVNRPRNDQVVPMDVDNIQTNSGKPAWQTKRTPEEKAQCQKEGRCFRCMVQGHLATNCPKKRTPPTTQKVNNVSIPKTTTGESLKPNKPEKGTDLRSAVLNLDSAARQELISALLLDMAGDDMDFSINAIKSISDLSITILADMKGTNQKLRLLLDTGVSGNFIDHGAARLLGFTLEDIDTVEVRNADGTINADGTLKQKCKLTLVEGATKHILDFFVTDLGSCCAILGFPWFQLRKPIIDWDTKSYEGGPLELSQGGEEINKTIAQQMAMAAGTKKTAELPVAYQQFATVFMEEAAQSVTILVSLYDRSYLLICPVSHSHVRLPTFRFDSTPDSYLAPTP